jgi:hypothetical protein
MSNRIETLFVNGGFPKELYTSKNALSINNSRKEELREGLLSTLLDVDDYKVNQGTRVPVFHVHLRLNI